MKSALLWLIVLTLVAWTPSSRADDDLLTKLDEDLKAVATFEHGGDAGPLQRIEQTVFPLSPDSPLRPAVEQRLVDALQLAATSDGKAFLCTQLRVVGSKQCVPVLESLLADPQASHMARYALGRLEAPEASAALLRALPKTSGEIQAGIIVTLADRGVAGAKPELIKLLESKDATVSQAAAVGLGRLGGIDSLQALRAALADADAAAASELANAMLVCADGLAAGGQMQEAAEVFRQFFRSPASSALRFAGLRGLVKSNPDEASATLLEAIRAEDVDLSRYAISMTATATGKDATFAFAGLLPSLPPENQVLLLRALGTRGDSAATPAVIAMTRSEEESVRIAALEALGQAGDGSAAATLLQAATESSGPQQQVARAALLSLAGDDVEQRLVQAIDNAEAIRALAGRGAKNATPALLKAAKSEDAQVQREAIAALGVLAEPADLPAFVKLAADLATSGNRDVTLAALGKAFARAPDKESCAGIVLAEMDAAPAAAQPVLIRLLAHSGGQQALAAVRKTLGSTEPALRDAAVTALSEWQDAAVGEDLLKVIQTSDDAGHKQVALGGYLRLAKVAEDPSAMYLSALKRIAATNDKKAVLEGLGLSADSPAALAVALGYLADEDLSANAGVAALRIANQLRTRDEDLARSALRQVLAQVDHPDVRLRAQEVLNELDKYEDHILQWVGVGPFTEKGKDGQAIYATVFPPERPDADGIQWEPITKGIGSWDINLEATYGGLDFCAAYLRTQVRSDADQDALLEMGSDDGVKAWLNGRLVFDQWTESGAAPRQRKAEIRLTKGWNELLLKVVDQQGGWVGACRIRKPDGTRLDGLRIEAR